MNDQLALPQDTLDPLPVASGRVVNLRWYQRRVRPQRGVGYVLDLPQGVVRIDRMTDWGNPYKVEPGRSRGDAIAAFGAYATRRLIAEPGWLEPLRGRTLACWCAPLPCHGQVILELMGEA